MENKNVFTIKELSKILEISEHTIRKYESDFNLKIPRNNMGHRYYMDEELELFKRILNWKGKGFNKTTINNLLNHSVEAIEQKEKAIELVTLDNLTGAELKDLMVKQISDILLEREQKLQQEYENKLEKAKDEIQNKIESELEKQTIKLHEQIRAENNKLIEYIETTRKEEQKKSFWSKLFGK